jgi:hypothetical protein
LLNDILSLFLAYDEINEVFTYNLFWLLDQFQG